MQMLDIGSRVRIARRPFFRGEIKSIQLSLFKGESPLFFCKWRTKPDDWVSDLGLRTDELEIIEED